MRRVEKTGRVVHGLRTRLRRITLCGIAVFRGLRGGKRVELKTSMDFRRVTCGNCQRVKTIPEAD